MSDEITVTGATTAVTIYGTFAAAKDYVLSAYGAQYTTWTALSDDDKKRTLIAAVRYLEAQAWNTTTAADFATRDAIDAFAEAEYELAVLIAGDSTLTQNADAGSNVRAVGAGSARVEFFNPSTAKDGSASTMPAIVDRLVGKYLAARSVTSDGGIAQTGDCESPFACDQQLRRRWPWE